MKSLRVAPLFEKKYEAIFKELGLKVAANEELMDWYQGWQEARKDGEWEGDEISLQVSNGYNQLIDIKQSAVTNLMLGAPQLKGKRRLELITPEDVKQWMNAGRAWCISRQVYWKSFSRYMLTKHTLHDEILEGIRIKMSGKTFNAQAPWIITTYIEKIILDMMPPPAKFGEMRNKVIEEHVRAIEKHQTTVHLRSQLEEDAVQLTYVDPAYIGAQAQGQGYISDDQRKAIKKTIPDCSLISLQK